MNTSISHSGSALASLLASDLRFSVFFMDWDRSALRNTASSLCSQFNASLLTVSRRENKRGVWKKGSEMHERKLLTCGWF